MRGSDDTDRQIAAFAAQHHGVVSFAELRALGLGDDAIQHRVQVGRLHRRHKGVYAVGHPALSLRGRWRAAVLACGEGALLSHFDAAALSNMLPPRGRLIHVTRPSSSGRDPDPQRIELHRVRTLRPWEGTLTDGIPATTPARTLLDLAPRLRPKAIEDVVAQMVRLGLFDLLDVRRSLAEHPRQPGAPALRRLLDDLVGRDPETFRSMLEVFLCQLCDDHALPRPVVNARVEGVEIDFSWPQRRLVVEADSYTYHSMPSAFERDRERDQVLTLAGWTVVRVTHRQVTRDRRKVSSRIRRLLA